MKTFVKLPDAFTVRTPLGPYVPDWATLVERPDGSRYLVLETKGTSNVDLLRTNERGKIQAATEHFRVVTAHVGTPGVEYETVATINDLNGVVEGPAR